MCCRSQVRRRRLEIETRIRPRSSIGAEGEEGARVYDDVDAGQGRPARCYRQLHAILHDVRIASDWILVRDSRQVRSSGNVAARLMTIRHLLGQAMVRW